MLPKYLAQIVVAGATAIGRAVRKAAVEHLSRERVAPSSSHASKSEHDTARQQTAKNVQLGITVDESIKILNVDRDKLDPEQIEKNFAHLFAVNDKAKGGSFYIQSKVVRAKERLDAEMEAKGIKMPEQPEKTDENNNDSNKPPPAS